MYHIKILKTAPIPSPTLKKKIKLQNTWIFWRLPSIDWKTLSHSIQFNNRRMSVKSEKGPELMLKTRRCFTALNITRVMRQKKTTDVFYFNQSFKWYLRVKYQFSLKRPFWLRLAFWGCGEVLIKIICSWEFHLRRRWQLVAESTDSVAHVSPLSWWDGTSRESWTLAQKSTLEGFT